MADAVRLSLDRSLSVPSGKIIKTGYVPIERVILACRERMAVGDVEAAYRKRLELGSSQPWPPPTGHWRSDFFFCIKDGRHEYVAALMLGSTHILVAWLDDG